MRPTAKEKRSFSSDLYPHGWGSFRNRIRKKNRNVIPDKRDVEDVVFNFGNRFRLARSFKGIWVLGYSDRTVKGYEALICFLLAWSAMELWVEAQLLSKTGEFNRKKAGLAMQDELFEKFEPTACRNILLEYRKNEDYHKKLCSLIESDKLREHLDSLFNGESHNVRPLGSAIRHAFAHGPLAAHSGGKPPAGLSQMLWNMRDQLLAALDEEFSDWLKNLPGT